MHADVRVVTIQSDKIVLNKVVKTLFDQQSFRNYPMLSRKEKATFAHGYISLITLFCFIYKLQW